jgi:hypothetical protein
LIQIFEKKRCLFSWNGIESLKKKQKVTESNPMKKNKTKKKRKKHTRGRADFLNLVVQGVFRVFLGVSRGCFAFCG